MKSPPVFKASDWLIARQPSNEVAMPRNGQGNRVGNRTTEASPRIHQRGTPHFPKLFWKQGATGGDYEKSEPTILRKVGEKFLIQSSVMQSGLIIEHSANNLPKSPSRKTLTTAKNIADEILDPPLG